MRTRAKIHYKDSSYWIIQYKRHSWSPFWTTLRQAFCDVECGLRSSKNFPVLVSEDEAREIASTLTEAKLAEYQAKRKADWAQYKLDRKAYLAKRKQVSKTVYEPK